MRYSPSRGDIAKAAKGAANSRRIYGILVTSDLRTGERRDEGREEGKWFGLRWLGLDVWGGLRTRVAVRKIVAPRIQSKFPPPGKGHTAVHVAVWFG